MIYMPFMSIVPGHTIYKFGFYMLFEVFKWTLKRFGGVKNSTYLYETIEKSVKFFEIIK